MLLQAPRSDTEIIGSGPKGIGDRSSCFSANQRSEHLPGCTGPMITWLRIATGGRYHSCAEGGVTSDSLA